MSIYEFKESVMLWHAERGLDCVATAVGPDSQGFSYAHAFSGNAGEIFFECFLGRWRLGSTKGATKGATETLRRRAFLILNSTIGAERALIPAVQSGGDHG